MPGTHFAERNRVIARQRQCDAVILVATACAPSFDHVRHQHDGASLPQIAGVLRGDLQVRHGIQHRMQRFEMREQSLPVLSQRLKVGN